MIGMFFVDVEVSETFVNQEKGFVVRMNYVAAVMVIQLCFFLVDSLCHSFIYSLFLILVLRIIQKIIYMKTSQFKARAIIMLEIRGIEKSLMKGK